MRFKEIISESTTILKQMYQGDYPDRDEMFWDYVRPDEFDRDLEIQKLSPFKLKMMLTSHYQVEDLEELVDMIDEEDRLELLQRYQNDPNLSNRIIVVADGMIVDGNHRALAAALSNRPINYVDLADLEIEPEDEQLDEIKRLPKDEFTGAGGLSTVSRSSAKFKPLIDDLQYCIVPFGRQTQILVSETSAIKQAGDHIPVVAMLCLYPSLLPLPNAVEVSSITVLPEFRGKGIAKALYILCLTRLKYTVVAGDSQTPGGQRNWTSLASIPGVEVIGYLKVTGQDLEDDEAAIDTIMGMGSQYIGSDKFDDLYFAFEVMTTPGKKSMKAAATKAYKLYTHRDEYQTAETGMFARVGGV